MLAPYEHGNLLDAMSDESVSPPLGLPVRGKQLLITKYPHLVIHESRAAQEYNRLPPDLTRLPPHLFARHLERHLLGALNDT